jgi:ATP-binding cassette subfamily B (MDR/TAP) protein 1
MGDGLVLESGTHSDLIQASGAYARLVQSQKLREGRERSDSIDDASESENDIEKEIREEIPLGRRNTGHSLASEILEQKKQAMGEKRKEKGYDLSYLFKRMFLIVSDRWKAYFFGTVFACRTCCVLSFVYILFSFLYITFLVSGMVFPAFGIVYAQGISAFSLTNNEARRHAGDRVALWYV